MMRIGVPPARTMVLVLVAACFVACNPEAEEPQLKTAKTGDATAVHNAAEPPVTEVLSFLVFGDHGYHFDWPEKKDLERAPQSKNEWYETHLGAARYEAGKNQPDTLPAIEMSPVTGGYVLSTGLYRVSDQMHEACSTNTCRFALMLGDNVYPQGADGKDDVLRFEDILKKPLARLGHGRENFRIYATLGNHDWKTSREGARAQLQYLENTSPFYMDGYNYRVVPEGMGGNVEIFAIDTQMLLSGTDVHKLEPVVDNVWEVDEDELVSPPVWAIPQTEEEQRIVEWLGQALRQSMAKWKIVIGHHPLWSSAGGKYAQSIALRKLILPTLCRHADIYLSGHEHTLELHQYDCSVITPDAPDSVLTQVVSGAAGKQRMLNVPFMKMQDENDTQMQTLFALGSTWGYTKATLEDDEMKIDMFSVGLDGEQEAVFSHTVENRID